MVGIYLAAIDELFGDAFVQAKVDENHELYGILYGIILRRVDLTSSSMTKFLIIL